MTTLTAKEKLAKARAGLILSQPFFASMMLRLAMREDPSCETLWTDGKAVGYNPEYVYGCTLDETKTLVCHETLHCACAHQTRRGNRDPKRWNIACDYAINGILESAGFTLPRGALVDHALDGKTAEEIYGSLPEDPPGNQGESADPGKCGEVRDCTNEEGNLPSPADLKQHEEDWKVILSQAAQGAKGQGSLPAGMERLVEDILQPIIDWRSVLRRFVDQAAKSDYSWARPNRRHIHNGLYLPSLHSEDLPPIVVAIDTSGSIDQGLLDQFAAEVSAILEDYKTTVNVLYCDSEITGQEEFSSDDLPITLHPSGGGGTDLRPVFQRIDQAGEVPACLIYLTDLMGDFPEQEPPYPVLWAKTGDYGGEAPFGETVELRLL